MGSAPKWKSNVIRQKPTSCHCNYAEQSQPLDQQSAYEQDEAIPAAWPLGQDVAFERRGTRLDCSAALSKQLVPTWRIHSPTITRAAPSELLRGAES